MPGSDTKDVGAGGAAPSLAPAAASAGASDGIDPSWGDPSAPGVAGAGYCGSPGPGMDGTAQSESFFSSHQKPSGRNEIPPVAATLADGFVWSLFQ